jgi:nucleoside-diphosphate-sugar epimerase
MMDNMPQPRTSEDVIAQITALVPAGSPPAPAVMDSLMAATDELISVFREEGKLDENPVKLAMERTVDLHREAAIARLEGRKVIVTGGAGCVGTRLIPILKDLGAASITVIDNAPDAGKVDVLMGTTTYEVDICDVAAMDAVFAQVKPDVVFHLASVREPGRAEQVVREAIDTNVFGTRNVIDACVKHEVADAIYSSTGKCFAYITDHVYTGSKKLAEAQWVVASRNSTHTRFRFTRFTHIMENGVVAAEIEEGINAGLIPLHGADRNFNVQNLRQATHLLVNALALADITPPDGYWSAIDLGWPVNTLEMALYNLEQSGKRAAVYFKGVPKGYDEAFFRGQFNWTDEFEYHPLINALEGAMGFADDSGTMVGARVQPFCEKALAAELDALQAVLDEAGENPSDSKAALLVAVQGLARAIFAQADFPRLVNVLWWGAAPDWAGPEAKTAARFKTIIGILTDAVATRLDRPVDAIDAEISAKLADIAETLGRIPELADKRRHLLSALRLKTAA